MASRQTRRAARSRPPVEPRRRRSGIRLLVLIAAVALAVFALAGPALVAVRVAPTPS
ncbi:MAG: hypothetical protein IVW53_13680 [Chloroflexi bacterium]|nr:hypothetical protein [Chloroflexota bacterium]